MPLILPFQLMLKSRSPKKNKILYQQKLIVILLNRNEQQFFFLSRLTPGWNVKSVQDLSSLDLQLQMLEFPNLDVFRREACMLNTELSRQPTKRKRFSPTDGVHRLSRSR